MKGLACLCFLVVLVGSIAEDFHLEYYTSVTLECDDTKYNFTNTAQINERYWLIPSGDIISAQGGNFSLTVHRISDSDFGHYFCILVRSDLSIDRIMHGVNSDGPYFGDLLEKYTNKAIVGGIAAGSLFVVVAGSCLVWQLRYQRKSSRNKAVDELDKAIDGYDLRAYDNVGVDNIELEEKKNGGMKDDEKVDTEKKS